MVLDKNIGKKLLVGMATVALFTPVALGGAKAHASAFDDAVSPENTAKVSQQSAQVDKQRDAEAKAHPEWFNNPNTAWNTGSHASSEVNQETAGQPASNDSNLANKSSSSNDGSSNNYTGSNTATQSNDSNHPMRDYKTDKSGNVKYPNAPKTTKKHDQKNNNKKLAQKLNGYGKDISKKSVRKDLKKVTHNSDKFHSRKTKNELKKITKNIHGAKNRANFQKLIKQL